MTTIPDFTEDQIRRYARHIVLPEVGGAGQGALMRARVLVVGAGGLGSPLIQYLAAAGVGTLGVVDDDTVDLSNLQRQILHGTPDVGRPKVDSAADAVARLNPDVIVVRHRLRLTAGTVADLLDGYDIVCDGSDNFETRFLVNDACHWAGKTLVSAAVLRFDGQLSVYKTHAGGPCYRCVFPAPPPPDTTPTCGEPAFWARSPASWAPFRRPRPCARFWVRTPSMAGRLLIYDARGGGFREVRIPRDPACPLCGEAATIPDPRA